jgi:hypothetical protein
MQLTVGVPGLPAPVANLAVATAGCLGVPAVTLQMPIEVLAGERGEVAASATTAPLVTDDAARAHEAPRTPASDATTTTARCRVARR